MVFLVITITNKDLKIYWIILFFMQLNKTSMSLRNMNVMVFFLNCISSCPCYHTSTNIAQVVSTRKTTNYVEKSKSINASSNFFPINRTANAQPHHHPRSSPATRSALPQRAHRLPPFRSRPRHGLPIRLAIRTHTGRRRRRAARFGTTSAAKVLYKRS